MNKRQLFFYKFMSKFKFRRQMFALMIAILLFNGCATIGYRADMESIDEFDDVPLGIYPCVRLDLYTMKKIIKGEEETVFFLFKPIALLLYSLDTGASFIFDTIALPYDIYRTRKYKEEKNLTTTIEEVKNQ